MPSAVDYLVKSQHHSGGWGYSPSHQPVVEPTSVAVLALRNEPAALQAVELATAWLMDAQNEDGGWGIHEQDRDSGWHTAWAVLGLHNTSGMDEPLQRGVDWLTYVPTAQIGLEVFKTGEIPSIEDPGAVVWPWMPGQVTWVEPTALAVLALSGQEVTALARTRLQAALEYFRLNRTSRGGWDTGNAGPLDEPVTPRAYQTSLVLMALARSARDQVRSEDIDALKLDMAQDSSALSLACGLLALRLLGEDDPSMQERLLQAQNPDESWDDNPFFTAWTILALRGAI